MTEFVVTMTTRVPDGTSQQEIDELRRGESAQLRGLAVQGHLQRLWRTSAPPGASRTVGLFDADDESRLDKLLSSTPLRIWRTDDIAPLGAHPGDPAGTGVTGRPGKGPESLIAMTITVPSGTPSAVVEASEARQAVRVHDLAERGHLVRLWTLPDSPDGPRMIGLWRARDPGELMVIVESLPLSEWMTIETTPLRPHPDDPIRRR